MSTKIELPEFVSEEHLDYLDALRISGVTNMFGAAPYLSDEYGLGKAEARQILSFWMKSFHLRHPEG